MNTDTIGHKAGAGVTPGEGTPGPVLPNVNPECVDLVAAVASVLQTCRHSVARTARAAATFGVTPETLEASLVVTVVEEWLSQRPRTFPADVTVRDVNAIEATRAAAALAGGGDVRLSLHLPPMLMIRLVELAGESGGTPEGAAVDVLRCSADAHYGRACKAAGKPKPRPWSHGG